MSYNKKLFKQMVEESKKKKTSPNPFGKDKILDPMGQWKFPGQVTRIPSNRITMQGVPYPVKGVGSSGQEQMMYPGQEYSFPGSKYVDEYPLVKAQNGIDLNLPKYNKLEDKTFSVNPYTFGFNPDPGVNIFGIGVNPHLNLLNKKKDKLALTGDVSSVSVGYPGGYELFTKPQYDVGLKYTHTFKNGGDISIPNLEEGSWLNRYDDGGSTTTETTRPPVYVNNPNDPRLKAYNDSLFLFNKNAELLKGMYDKKYKLQTKEKANLNSRLISLAKTADKKIPLNYVTKNMNLKNEGNGIYSLDDYASGIIDRTLPRQYFKSGIMPQGFNVFTQNLLGLGFGDKRVAFDYSNVKPVQPVVYKKPNNKIVDKLTRTEQFIPKPKPKEQPQLKMVGNERRDIAPSFNTRILSPNIHSIARPDNKYMVSYTDEEGVGREEYFPTAELADQYMDWRRANNMFYGTGMSRRGVFQDGGENDGVQRIKIKNNDGTYSYLRSDSKEYYDLIQSGAIDESSFNQKDTAFSLKQKPKKVIQAPVVKKDEGPSFLDNLTSNFSNLYSKFKTAINEVPLDARGITIASGFSGLQPRKINLPSKQTIQTIVTAPLLTPAVGLNNLANKVVEYTNILANMWDRRGPEGWEGKPDDVVTTKSSGILKSIPIVNKENKKTPTKSMRSSSFQMGDYIDSEHYNTHPFLKVKERLVHTPTYIDLNDDKLTYGYRNRNEYKDINTPGLFITTIAGRDSLDNEGKNSIRKYKDSEIIDSGGYIGIDDNGKLYIDYGKNLKGKNLKAMTDIDFVDGVTGFARSGNTYKYGDETDNKQLSKVAHLQLKDGKTSPMSMILVNRDQDLKSQENLFGKNTGGKAIIASPDLKYKIYVAGSIKDIDNAIQEFKNFYGLDYVKYGRLDNGSYKQPLQTKSGKISKRMLERYDALNFVGGNAFYLNPVNKKLGGDISIPNLEQSNWLDKYK